MDSQAALDWVAPSLAEQMVRFPGAPVDPAPAPFRGVRAVRRVQVARFLEAQVVPAPFLAAWMALAPAQCLAVLMALAPAPFLAVLMAPSQGAQTAPPLGTRMVRLAQAARLLEKLEQVVRFQVAPVLVAPLKVSDSCEP